MAIRRTASPLREVTLATAAVAVVIGAVELAAPFVPWIDREGGALVAAAFLGVPLWLGRGQRLPFDPLALPGRAPLRALGWSLAVSALVLAVFAVGHDVWQVLLRGHVRAPPVLDGTALAYDLAAQFVVVAIPEEAFFRGYVLQRLNALWPARRRVFGVPFGLPHVVSALLFALVHLVAVPQPHRLLVFFPGLVFAWLAERSGGALAPAVHHTLANLTLQVLQRCYR